jgi:O-antigen/teichoic acid export membrane protein
VLGHLLYNGVGTVGLFKKFVQTEWKELQNLRKLDLADSFRSNLGYLYYSTPENLANIAAIQLPIIAIAAHPIAGEVGHLYLAQMIMMFPMMLIGSSVGQVFIVDAPEHRRKKNLLPFVLTVMRGLLVSGVPVLVLLGILAPFLAGPVLGEQWGTTGYLIAWITPWIVLQFLSTPLSTIFYVLELQYLAMILQIFSLFVRYGTVLVTLSIAPDITMEAYAISGAVIYLCTLFLVLLVARNES